MTIESILANTDLRHRIAPVTAKQVYLAHAGVAPMPGPAVEAMTRFLRLGSTGMPENPWCWQKVTAARDTAARLIGSEAVEISLLGPTALGLSLVANGLSWKAGDEVVSYADDYPANVYPWKRLERFGVRCVAVRPESPGAIDWAVVEAVITDRTRLVSLASCHFLSGNRIDVDDIGRRLQERGILFCVDGIQTLGAFPLSVKHVDFLSADSHKWLLGPAGAGILYVNKRHFNSLEPTLVGSWNVVSPDFIAQAELAFPDTGQRYEPGMLNLPGIVGMQASMQWLLDLGIEAIAARLIALRQYVIDRVRPLGFDVYGNADGPAASGIITLTHESRSCHEIARKLAGHNIIVSPRRDREGRELLRLSPHFYTLESEIDFVVEHMR